MTPASPVLVRLRLIGQMEAWTLTSESILPTGRKTRGLLAIVALSAPRPVLRGKLAEMLWSRRPEEQARASLRQEIHRLLDALDPLGSQVLSITRDHLALRPGMVWVDVEELLRASPVKPAALGLFDGELLEDLDGIDPAFDNWLASERERLGDRARTLAELLLREQTDPEAMIPAAQQLLRIDRAHEGAWRALMRAYTVRGERGMAIQAYERCRAVLADQLDAQPSMETQRLATEIRSVTATRQGGMEATTASRTALARGTPRPLARVSSRAQDDSADEQGGASLRAAAGGRDGPSYETSAFNISLREAGARSSDGRPASFREAGPRDLGSRDAGPADAGFGEPALRDTAPRDPGVRDPVVREPGVRDTASRENGAREFGFREPRFADFGYRESGPRDPGPRGGSPRDGGQRDVGAQGYGIPGNALSGQDDPGHDDPGQDAGRSATPRTGARVGVLPLQLVGTSEMEAHLSTGLADEITSALARFRWMFLVSSTALARLATQTRDEAVIRRAFGLDFVLDGSVQRAATRLRVSLRLLDLRGGNQVVWSRRFDREADDLLTLQDEIAAEAVAQIDPEILLIESQRASASPMIDPTAHDLVLRALPLISRLERPTFMQAGDLLRRALALEPDYAASHAWYAFWHLFLVGQSWAEDKQAAIAEAERLAERAITLDPQDAKALTIAGHVRGFLHHRQREALALHDRALSLNPNLAMAWNLSGVALACLGDHDEAERRIARYRKLSPLDPQAFFLDEARILMALLRRDHAGAVSLGRDVTGMNTLFVGSLKPFLAALGHLGMREEAERVRGRLLNLEPGFTVGDFLATTALEAEADRMHYAEGLILAGLNE